MKTLRRIGFGVALAIAANSILWAQGPRGEKPKPRRVPAPKFDEKAFPGVFFDDVKAQLVGSLPAADAGAKSEMAAASDTSSDVSGDNADNIWKRLIDTATLEDLVKNSKSRLDAAITSPAKFAAGGFQTARRDFTVLSVVFGVIEEYPGDVRWKHSAARAKADFAKVAANAKVGTPPVFAEAKLKNQMLDDLLRGERLDASKEEAKSWADMADRTGLMQVLEWSLRENLNATVANDGAFADGADNARKFAQLTAVIGEILNQPNMPDQDADEYRQWIKEMSTACQEIIAATEKPDITKAREAISRLDKSCTSCHDGFR